jgi:hypothetical protein
LPADAMRARLELACPANGTWVADGNYESKGGELVRERVETVIWLDFPRMTVMRQLAWRTLRRCVLGQELWNGNRESLRDALSRDPVWCGPGRDMSRSGAGCLLEARSMGR